MHYGKKEKHLHTLHRLTINSISFTIQKFFSEKCFVRSYALICSKFQEFEPGILLVPMMVATGMKRDGGLTAEIPLERSTERPVSRMVFMAFTCERSGVKMVWVKRPQGVILPLLTVRNLPLFQPPETEIPIRGVRF